MSERRNKRPIYLDYQATTPTDPRVVEATQRAQRILVELFGVYLEDPGRLPAHVVARFGEEGEARAVGDYIAGMTDRYAIDEHRRLVARESAEERPNHQPCQRGDHLA